MSAAQNDGRRPSGARKISGSYGSKGTAAGKGSSAAAAHMRNKRRQLAKQAQAFLIFLLPTPLLITAILAIFRGKILLLGWAIALYVVFILAAGLVKRGLSLEAEFRARRLARAALVPYKLLGAILLGLATMVTAWTLAKHGFGLSIVFGIGAIAGCLLLYGFDPRGAKGIDDDSGVDSGKVVAALETARAKLVRIENAGKKIRNRDYQKRITSLLGHAYLVLDEIENDPRDLRRARKFLNVYLDGAVEVTERYAKTYEKTQTETLEKGFGELLTDMENVFREQHDKLLQDDELDLDVQMDVLRQRLKREGVM